MSAVFPQEVPPPFLRNFNITEKAVPRTAICSGDGGIRTLVPGTDKTISSRSRYDHFDTSPDYTG